LKTSAKTRFLHTFLFSLGILFSLFFIMEKAYGIEAISDDTADILRHFRLEAALERLGRDPSLQNRHVLFFHWDAARSDLTEAMLQKGQLPYLEFLLRRGRLSLVTSTVDKSETMGVVPKYLASKRDLGVVGWWQFNR